MDTITLMFCLGVAVIAGSFGGLVWVYQSIMILMIISIIQVLYPMRYEMLSDIRLVVRKIVIPIKRRIKGLPRK